MSADRRRVVVTGMGVVSPIGHDLPSSFEALLRSEHGIRRMPEWDFISDLHTRLGSTVEGLDLQAHYPRKKRRTMGKVALLAVHAAEQAVAQAELTEAALTDPRTGVAFGSTSGSGEETERFSMPLVTAPHTMRGLQSNAYFRLMTHTCSVNVAQFFQVRGRVESTCSACTSSAQAIGRGYELIRAGIQDVMICGGAEEMHYMAAVTFDLLMATSHRYNDQPAMSPRPFDAARDGLVVGEGGGALVLESYAHARARGATILAELTSYASNCDGAHLTAPRQEGMRAVMELALADAALEPSAIDYVCAHGTGTEIGDVAESQATASVFGENVPFSSLKGYVGHTLGACGAIESAWTIEMMRRKQLIANRNLETIDPACGALDYLQAHREATLSRVMSNNFAFGGINTSLIFSNPEALS